MATHILDPQFKSSLQESIDRIALLNILGAKKVRTKGNEIRCTCPIHGGDNPEAFALYPDGNWVCYTHHCGEGKKQDLISLVQKSRSVRYGEAIAILCAVAGVNPIFLDTRDNSIRDQLTNASWSSRVGGVEIYSASKNNSFVINERIVNMAISCRTNHLQDRNFDNDTMNTFEVGYIKNWKGQANEGRVTFPLRHNGLCVGLQGRAVSGVKGTAKDGTKINTFPRGKKYDWLCRKDENFDKSPYLYNLDLAVLTCFSSKRIILTEGVTDVMRLWQYGIRDCVSLLGSDVSKSQAQILSSEIWKIYWMLDNDAAGGKSLQIFLDNYYSFFDVYLVKLTSKDPAEMTAEEVYYALGNAKKISY